MDQWQKPYINGRATKRFSHLKEGVYFIRDIFTKEILYIGMSRYSIYKALYRHFNKWVDVPCRQIFDKNKIEVRIIICPDAHGYEKRLIRYFQPISNRNMYVEKDPFWHDVKKCPF